MKLTKSQKNRARLNRRRLRVYAEQGGRCYLCDRVMISPEMRDDHPHHEELQAEWEHITPRYAGGTDSLDNLALACVRCNRSKHNLMPVDITSPEGRDRAWAFELFLRRMLFCQPIGFRIPTLVGQRKTRNVHRSAVE